MKPRMKVVSSSLWNELQELRLENQRLRELIDRDQLTSLFNAKVLKQDIEAATKANPFRSKVVLFLDVDHFRTVNEVFGHWAASRVLARLGKVISLNIREEDRAYRYGGDEFVVLVDGDFDQANQMAERLRQKIESSVFGVKISDKQHKIQITASIGVRALLPSDKVADVIDLADKAMYQAKRHSRNCVMVA